jgi:hypothetical protein
MPPYLPIKAVAAFAVSFLILALVPAAVSAQGNGSIYMVQGASVPIFFNFSVTGQTFLATILTFGSGGNGRWFAATGSTDGVSGTGQLLFPSGFALTLPPAGSLHFDLDQPGGTTGSFTTNGLSSFLSLTSGRMVRLFP